MIDFVAFSKYCATCHYWIGERRPERGEMRVYTPRHATIGTCDCPHGHWRGRLKPAESNCPHWSRWEVMREDPSAPPLPNAPRPPRAPPTPPTPTPTPPTPR